MLSFIRITSVAHGVNTDDTRAGVVPWVAIGNSGAFQIAGADGSGVDRYIMDTGCTRRTDVSIDQDHPLYVQRRHLQATIHL